MEAERFSGDLQQAPSHLSGIAEMTSLILALGICLGGIVLVLIALNIEDKHDNLT